MNINFEPKDEGWHVTIKIPESNRSIEVGQLSHIAKERWHLHSLDQKEYSFDAKDLDAAREHLNTRLQMGLGSLEHLREESMIMVVDMNLHMFNVLACRSGSLKGWVAGIGTALGRFLMEDLPEGSDEKFWKELRQVAEHTRDSLRSRAALNDELQAAVSHLRQTVGAMDSPHPATRQ